MVWQIAVARDLAFAEAWYNLAMAAEDDKQADLAIAQYRRAVQAQPDYADAQFNLALLMTQLDRCSEALAAWGSGSLSRSRHRSRRGKGLCRERGTPVPLVGFRCMKRCAQNIPSPSLFSGRTSKDAWERCKRQPATSMSSGHGLQLGGERRQAQRHGAVA